MPNSYDTLRAERKDILTNCKSIVAKAQADNRELTDNEQRDLESAMARVKTLDEQIEGAALVKSVMSLDSADQDPDNPGGHTIFNETAAKGLLTAVRTRTSYRAAEVPAKALLGSTTLLPPTGQYVEPGVYPGAFPLATMLRQAPADGPVQRYYRMGGATAAVVAEGGLKPDAGVVTEAVDLPIEKIATTSKVSDELAQDAAYLLAALNAELVSAVVTMENDRIMAALGGTSGILTATGATADIIDLTAAAVASQEAVNGSTPSVIVVNPMVLGTIRQAKASTGGSYFIDPLAAGPAMLHGVRLVSSASTAAGEAWVINGAGVTIYRRGGITFEVGHSGDDWQRNQSTARCEERIGVAVTRPSMVSRITLT